MSDADMRTEQKVTLHGAVPHNNATGADFVITLWR